MYSEDLVVDLLDVSKHFEIYDHPRDQLKQLVKPLFDKLTGRTRSNFYSDFHALKDINLSVRKGESIGLIGRNGSGKSTLLQVIAGTLVPSGGWVNTYGRIGALLELGSGFNPEFTGRENVLISAAVLGLNDDQISSRIESIIKFADIGEHLDRPVRTYSSGMMVRLAFSVQISLDPDILIIDEALAVGDALFQKKCMDELQRLNESGVTLIVVSHDANSIKNLCTRAVLLEKGQMLASGEVKTVFNRYELLLHSLDKQEDKRGQETSEAREQGLNENQPVVADAQNAEILEFDFRDGKDNLLKTIVHGEHLFVRAKILVNKSQC